MPQWTRCLLVVALVSVCGWPSHADDPPANLKDPRVVDASLPDLSDFRTVDTAVTTRVSLAAPGAAAQPGYLGVSVEEKSPGQLVVALIEPESPAAKAGLQPGDVVRQVQGQAVRGSEVLADLLRSRGPGESVKITVVRDAKDLELSATLTATSRPLSIGGQRASLGVQVAAESGGVKIQQVLTNSAAEQAGLKSGDVLLTLNGKDIADADRLTSLLGDQNPGDTVTIVLQRGDKKEELKVKLGATQPGPDPREPRGGWNERMMNVFRKPVYRLAVIPIEYPDVKHNARISTTDIEDSLFSTGVYNAKSITGQSVYGSMNDYYHELSCGVFRVEGKCFDWVTVGKKRSEYSSDTTRSLLTEAVDKLLSRDGKNALQSYDGIYFLYAGERVQTNRGGIYWPHRASLSHNGKRWPYFICPEGGRQLASISVISHEFGHMLGLPDLYARPETPGSEGLGIWCTMSVGHGRDGKPLHFSAWCKEQLGWLKPTLIDPTVKQKLILAPITSSPKECFKVLLRQDGSEYLLLENRARRGYDRDLPAEGLLIWRIVDGKPVLEESHGIAGPEGPGRFLGSVPYPSKSNNAFTPYTTPSSKSQKGGGLPVHITNIQRLPDGRVTFYIGFEYL